MNKKRLAILLGFFIVLLLTGASCQSTPKDGGIYKTTDQAETWQQKTFIKKVNKKTYTISEYEITCFAFDPKNSDTLYAGTKSNGIIVTKDAGESWQNTGMNNGNITSLSINHADSNIIFASKDTTVLRSADAAANWEIVHTDTQKGNITKVIIDNYDPKKIYAASSSGIVYKSIDNGNNWIIKLQQTDGITNLYMRENDTRILYVLTAKGDLQRTKSGGEQNDWTSLITKEHKQKWPDAKVIKNFFIFKNQPNALYIATREGLLKSTDEGQNWTAIKTLIPSKSADNDKIINFIVDPLNVKNLYFTLTNSDKIHKSTDGGKEWHIIESFPSSQYINVLTISSLDSKILYAGMLSPPKKKGLFGQSK